MSAPSPVAKPGTACIGCRRRKLKCSREQDKCQNCLRSNLLCVYPPPETGVKRKRGPYKKDKHPRERHVEELLKYLEPSNAVSSTSSDADPHKSHAWRPGTHTPDGFSETGLGTPSGAGQNRSEELVKDALIALTKSSSTDRDSRREDVNSGSPGQPVPAESRALTINQPFNGSPHPSIIHIIEYWNIFTTRVDPIIKVIHSPTVSKQMFMHLRNLDAASPSLTVLLVSIYYAAVNSCTATESKHRFGESRDVLLGIYSRFIETALADNYGVPSLEYLQALVIYITTFRRQESGSNIRALFSLAVRMAQIMGLDKDSEAYSPFETQMRRRLWWHICGLESKGAEEGGARATSIIIEGAVALPGNLNDDDLDPNAREMPQSRAGVTDITYTLARWSIIRLMASLRNIRKRYKGADPVATVAELNRSYYEHKAGIESDFLQHMDASRPYDWMCIRFLKALLIKSRLTIDHPLGTTPKTTTSKEERRQLLTASVDIIKITNALALDKRIEDWIWYFRGYRQWHAFGVVVVELGNSMNSHFAQSAWAVVEPILVDWDRMYNNKIGEPPWDHVNDCIKRARLLRHQGESAMRSRQSMQKEKQPEGAIKSPPVTYTAVAQNQTYKYGTRMPSDQHGMVQPFTQQQSPPNSVSEPSTTYTYDQMGEFNDMTPPDFDNIDFGEFDLVFGNPDWEFPAPMDDFSMNMSMNMA